MANGQSVRGQSIRGQDVRSPALPTPRANDSISQAFSMYFERAYGTFMVLI